MGIILKSCVRAKGFFLKRAFDSLTQKPHASQLKFLLDIMRRNSNTEYGRKYGFSSIRNEKDYQKNVPIVSYQDIEPFVGKMIQGCENVLTKEMPFMFNVTSGTTDRPKYIPVTDRTKRRTARLMQQWLYRSMTDHPSILDRYVLVIAGSSVEGRSPSGAPCGSASGLIHRNLPRAIRSSYATPFIVSDFKNYELRYYATARLALEKDVSFVATPNPTTLIKVAETGIKYQEEIVRSIHAGSLFSNLDLEMDEGDLEIVRQINASLTKNRSRALSLEAVIRDKGRLLPHCCWPSLKLIGSWLGGSVGCQAEKLSAYYGEMPKRDIGYLSSEGCASIPYEDNTPSGILAIPNNYYEFVPEESDSENSPQPLLACELKRGELYKIILTNESGLYRYDINDTIRVDDYYNRTPVISFVRKSDDILNITGEKLHLNHFIMMIDRISSEFSISVLQFRVASNVSEMRYDICLELEAGASDEMLRSSVLPAIDSCLCHVNIEYAQKRKSGRLNPPRLHLMRSGWGESVKKAMMESGRQDIQYKWRFVLPDLPEIDCRHIEFSVDLMKR